MQYKLELKVKSTNDTLRLAETPSPMIMARFVLALSFVFLALS